MIVDKSKSLHELEGYDAGDPKTKTTPMVRRCLTLHRTPLEQWNADDCRLMLGQKFSPRYLVPLALEFLNEDPLEEGFMYPGALLNSVLRLPAEFWMHEQELWYEVNSIVEQLEELRQSIEKLAPEIKNFKTLQTE